eukprot:9338875-Pyramimonas_sp.AAC.1
MTTAGVTRLIAKLMHRRSTASKKATKVASVTKIVGSARRQCPKGSWLSALGATKSLASLLARFGP